MTDKISVKISSVTFFLCGIVLILCGCMNPVDIPGLLQDPIVQEIIKEKVKIHRGSDDYGYLIPGDGQISGLYSKEYYIVEEWDEADGVLVFQKNFFIKDDGNGGDFGRIGRLKEGQIGGLTNNYTYKIIKAKPLINVTSKYFTFNDTETKPIPVNGAVTIIGPDTYYLDLAPLIKAGNNYEVMKVPNTGNWQDNSRTSARYATDNIGSTVFPSPLLDGTNEPDGRYIKFKNLLVGIYQYTSDVKTNKGILLDNMSLLRLPLSYGTSDYVFAEFDTDGRVTNFVVLNIDRRGTTTPVASDYDIGNRTQTFGSVTAVTITPKAGKSAGAVTIYYNGSVTLPTAVGTYNVTFDVAAATGWNAASGLSAGMLTINAANLNPVASDYDIGNRTQTFGNVSAVTIMPLTGKSAGAVTIYYNGSATLPTAVGTYDVTFNVAAATGWNAASGLSAGTLTINAANPEAGDFIIGNLTQTFGNVSAVTITPKAGKSNGAVTIYYNGSATLPTAVGTYNVTFDVAAATGWNAAPGLSAGTLTINIYKPKVTVTVGTGFTQSYTPNITATVNNFSQSENSINITLNLTYPPAGGYTIAWYKDNSSTVGLGNGASITLNLALASNAGWWQADKHIIYLELTDSSGKLPPQSGSIIITVNP
jgi:hypothetical protein